MAKPVPIVDNQRYKDKVTIVTGGARGIGEGIAKLFAQHGSRVVAVDKRDEPAWITAVNSELPGTVDFYKCDLTNEKEVQAMISHVADKYGKLDCLINNAGWHPPHKPIDDFSADELRSLMDINFVSQFLTCKYSVPHLRKTKGNIINMSSMTQYLGQTYAVTYVATKGAITAFTKALAIDEAKYHVRVNSVSPSNVWTPLWTETRTSSDDEGVSELKKTAAEMQVHGQLGTPEDVGLACLYLAADAVFVTGTELSVSGGAELDYGYKTRLESDEICRWVHLKNMAATK